VSRQHGRGHAAQLRRECHRIAAPHVHHHLNLIEQIRRAWNVEARGAPGQVLSKLPDRRVVGRRWNFRFVARLSSSSAFRGGSKNRLR